jgi:galactonate dehydratase
MKITHIKTIVVNAQMRNWVFVKVETDVPGLWGWGEASLEWKTRAVVGAVEDIGRLLIGEDPRRIEYLWQMMYRQYFFKAGIIGMSALSGIDQACWDIFAKDRGLPLYRLLGGPVRDKVRMYDHLGGGEMKTLYETADPQVFAQKALESVEAGYTAVKVLAVPRTEPLEGTKPLRYAEKVMGGIRDAVGYDVDIMVDMHGRTTPAMAIQYACALEPYQPMFIEEPCQPENVDGMVEVARAIRIPVATGERLVTRFGFREVFEKRACAVAQPDVCHCGGITELRKIAAMADTYFISMAPHNPLGPIATSVNIQAAFCTPNFLIQEIMRGDVPHRDEVLDAPLVIKDGYVYPGERPGIGVEVNEQVAACYPYQPEAIQRYFHPDGSVADW